MHCFLISDVHWWRVFWQWCWVVLPFVAVSQHTPLLFQVGNEMRNIVDLFGGRFNTLEC